MTAKVGLSGSSEICSPLQDEFFVPPSKIKSSRPTIVCLPSNLTSGLFQPIRYSKGTHNSSK